MNDPKPKPMLTDSVSCGAGMVLFGQRWLVTDMSYVGHYEDGGMTLTLGLVPFESVDPCLYRIKPKRRRKKKGAQS
jgi:hypothetical protein